MPATPKRIHGAWFRQTLGHSSKFPPLNLERLFETDTHTEKSEDFSESNTASANQNPPGCINSLNVFFIEYYISYTGANVGPNGNIRPNKHIERACFLFFPGKLLWNMGARMYSEVWDSWDCNSCLDLDLAKKTQSSLGLALDEWFISASKYFDFQCSHIKNGAAIRM